MLSFSLNTALFPNMLLTWAECYPTHLNLSQTECSRCSMFEGFVINESDGWPLQFYRYRHRE